MEELANIQKVVLDVWNTNALGADVGTWISVLMIFSFFLVLRGVFARLVLAKISFLISKTKTKVDDSVFKTLERPLSFLPVAIGLFLATNYFEPTCKLAAVIYSSEKSFIAIALFWSLFNIVDLLSAGLQKLEKVFSKPMVLWLRKGIKFMIFFIGMATVLEIWGIKVAPLIASLGLFGVAVALGAQDMFKNLISGLTIIAEKRFQPGDWILVDGVVEGTVETIGFRSTQVRRFDKAPVHVPNSKLSDSAITNFTAMTHRRIKWKIGIMYCASIEQLRNIRDEIEKYIHDSEDFASQDEVSTFVRIDQFSDSSIDILLYCFTKTTNWGKWLAAKEKLAYKIKEVVESNGSGFAFPSRSLYVEQMPSDAPEVFVPPVKK